MRNLITLTTILIVAITLALPHSEKVSIKINYCPVTQDSKSIFRNQLDPLMKSLNDRVKLEMYPIGRSYRTGSGDDDSYCQPDGSLECYAKGVHLCINDTIQNFPDKSREEKQSLQYKFISCLVERFDESIHKYYPTKDCAKEVNLGETTGEQIEICANTTKFKDLFRQLHDDVDDLVASSEEYPNIERFKQTYPSILINCVYDENLTDPRTNLTLVVYKAFEEPPHKQCPGTDTKPNDEEIPPRTDPKPNNTTGIFIIIVIAVVLSLLIITGYFVYRRYHSAPNTPELNGATGKKIEENIPLNPNPTYEDGAKREENHDSESSPLNSNPSHQNNISNGHVDDRNISPVKETIKNIQNGSSNSPGNIPRTSYDLDTVL